MYNADGLVEKRGVGFDEIEAHLDGRSTVWINVDGHGDADLLRRLGERFDLHRLVMEDVVNIDQRAKVEAYEDHLFIVMRMIRSGAAESEQISMVLTPQVLITFQEREGDCFDPVRERIRHGRGRIRTAGTDYLAYALIDAVIDAYFPVLESFGDRLEALEADIFKNPEPETMHEIHRIKRELLGLRRAVWPLRDAVNSLVRDDHHTLIADETRTYLRDCYDHVIRAIDMVENYRELASSQMDLYLSSLGQRTNDIMKVLTIFAAIFIPLSFIAGLYGMNFDTDASPWNLPELSWAFGYPAVLGVMALVAGGLLFYFWRKGWIGSGSRDRRD